MTLTRKVFAASALAVFIGFPISGVFAESSSPMGDSGSAASAPAQSAPVNLDDATLQKAAKAYVKVKQIVHQEKQANPSGNAAQPQASDQSEKIAAVKNAGLDPQQYNEVIQIVQNDPQLQQKFATYVNQNGGEPD
jgi:Domain of unknown function (DUF4168)